MRTGYAFLLAAFSLSLTQLARANIFYLKDQWRGKDFFQGWNWETIDDPTHGRVNYVGLAEAQSKNLTNGTSFRVACPFLPSHFESITAMLTDFLGFL